jgi:DNA-binding winged helix-turn-helix (wHTH) protein/TolB-like protein
MARIQYVFGRFLLDVDRHLLLRDGDQQVRLTPKAFELLLLLVENHDRLVEKDALMKALWPDTFVEDSNLSFNVHQVRKALGVDGDGQQLIETVPRKGYRFRAPVRIVHDADSAGTLDDSTPPTGVTNGLLVPRVRRPWLLAVVVSAAAFAVAFYLYVRLVPAVRRTQLLVVSVQPSAVKRRTSVAVLDMHNASGRRSDDWLGTTVSEMLFTELSVGDSLRTIPRDAVIRMNRELGLDDADSLATDTLQRVRTNLKTDLVLTGSYTLLGQSLHRPIRLDLRVQDATTGEVLASIAETGVESSLFALVSDAGVRLREKPRVENASAVDALILDASLPSNPSAIKAYVEAVTRLRQSDALSARELFVKAIANDPKFPLAHSGLSEAWAALGYDEKAKSEAKESFDLSASVSQPQRLWIEASYRRLTHEWDLALDIYRRLQRFFPDDPDYTLQIADVQTMAGKPKDALATLDAFKTRPEFVDDARIDLASAVA